MNHESVRAQHMLKHLASIEVVKRSPHYVVSMKLQSIALLNPLKQILIILPVHKAIGIAFVE